MPDLFRCPDGLLHTATRGVRRSLAVHSASHNPIMLRSFVRVATIPACYLALSAIAQQPLNLDFERPCVTGTERPWGWEPHWQWREGSSGMDSSTVRNGRYSFRLEGPKAQDENGAEPVHAMMLRLPAESMQGKHVGLTAHVRTEAASYRILLNTWGEPGAADSVVQKSPTSQDWTTKELAVDVGPGEYQLVITLVVVGRGTAWFDDLVLTANGTPMAVLPSGSVPTAQDLTVLAAHSTPMDLLETHANGQWPAGYDAVGRVVGNADIVSLGESTHGTHEFFVAKRDLFQYLVEEHGFTVFAIEANQLSTERINAYVNGASDTVEKAMGGLFGVWYKQEVKDLIEWMREYNAGKPAQRLEFVGFDMQDPRLPMDSVVSYLRQNDPTLADQVESLYAEHHEAWRTRDYPQPEEGQGARWLKNAQVAYALVTQRMLDTPAGDPVTRRWAVQNANVVVQCATQANDPWNIVVRDSCMSANIAWILEQRPAGTRIAVWAHDSHIGRVGFASGTSMGAHMVSAFGDRLRVIGISTYDGSYSATRTFTDHRKMTARCFPAPAGSLEEAMHRVLAGRKEALLLDMRAAARDTSSNWLSAPRPVRSIGYSAFDFGFEQPTVLASQFDAVLLIDHTTPSRKIE